ncbi:hypothetical protein MBLNU457_4566t1 [Dothideomycetes sp. NU457]
MNTRTTMLRSPTTALNGTRRYASISSGKHFRDKGPPLSLEHFVQRQKALHLWRDIIRSLHKVPKSNTRSEMRQFARDEFERNKDVLDIGHIRYLISTGRTQFDAGCGPPWILQPDDEDRAVENCFGGGSSSRDSAVYDAAIRGSSSNTQFAETGLVIENLMAFLRLSRSEIPRNDWIDFKE